MLALIAGIPLAVAGYLAMPMAFVIGVLYMDRPDEMPPIARIVQLALAWGGAIAFLIGILLVVASLAWWLWRLGSRIAASLRAGR